MPVKRRVSKARAQLSELAYKFLTDAPLSEEEKADLEYFMLEFNQFDFSINADTETLWKRHGAEILKDWLKSKPDTRPTCWWLYSSGLERKRGPMKLTEKTTIKNAIYSLEDSIPVDQAAWLKQHGFD